MSEHMRVTVRYVTNNLELPLSLLTLTQIRQLSSTTVFISSQNLKAIIMRNTTSNPMINSDIYNIALHTSGLTLGPMPVLDFLNKFLPNAEGSEGRTRRGVFSRLPSRRLNEEFVSYVRIIL